ncbi:MAG: hypothetical protein HY438_03165 [DPANN group archaeon]|nr:hypothetical protein [DPANN group archaeon]
MLIVKILGVHSAWQNSTPPGVTDYDKYSLQPSPESPICIESEDGTYHYGDEMGGAGKGLTIEFKGKLVYAYNVGLKTYIPGRWEGQLDKLYEAALNTKKMKEAAELDAETAFKAVKERELREQFGL